MMSRSIQAGKIVPELAGRSITYRALRLPAFSPNHCGRTAIIRRRYVTQSGLPSTSSRGGRPPMPLDQPREDYTAPTLYTLSYLSRVLRLVLYTALGLGVTGLTVFEGWHLYIEKVLLAAPSGSPPPGGLGGEDEYGWTEENVSWTGRSKGGTDPRLGWKARHALRAAFVCQEYGAGGPSATIGRERGIHPGALGGVGSAEVNRVDRGYELAEEYIDLAINEARKRGMVFPGEPRVQAGNEGNDGVQTGADATVIDLLLLKAGVLERLATPQTLVQARGIYQDVFAEQTLSASSDIQGGQGGLAKRMRLAGKIGDLSQRTGGEGSGYWRAGLAIAGVDLDRPAESVSNQIGGSGASKKTGRKGWFSWGSSASESDRSNSALTGTLSGLASTSINVAQLSPSVLRAALTSLISVEANQATSSQLVQAGRTQTLALSLIPTISSQVTVSADAAALHNLWLDHRRALLTLHAASVSHAQSSKSLLQSKSSKSEALTLASAATSQAESLLPHLPTYSRSSPLSVPAKVLSTDAQSLAAEANFTKGLLLEKTEADLEAAGECFERAMTLNGEDRGTGVGRYWKAWARVKSKLDQLKASAQKGVKQ